MTCQEVRAQLSAFLDGELDEITAAQLREHLKTCPRCNAAMLDMISMTGLLAGGEDVPAGFAQRVMDALPAQDIPKKDRRFAFGGFTALAAVAAVLALCVATGTIRLPAMGANTARSTDLAAAAVCEEEAPAAAEPEACINGADSPAEAAPTEAAPTSRALTGSMEAGPANGLTETEDAAYLPAPTAEAPAEPAAVEAPALEPEPAGGPIQYSVKASMAGGAAEEEAAPEEPAEECCEAEADTAAEQLVLTVELAGAPLPEALAGLEFQTLEDGTLCCECPPAQVRALYETLVMEGSIDATLQGPQEAAEGTIIVTGAGGDQ